MEVLEELTKETTRSDQNRGGGAQDNVFVRFCRKKFVCVMSFIFCLIIVLEIVKMFLSSADKEQVAQISNFLLSTLVGVIMSNNITTSDIE